MSFCQEKVLYALVEDMCAFEQHMLSDKVRYTSCEFPLEQRSIYEYTGTILNGNSERYLQDCMQALREMVAVYGDPEDLMETAGKLEERIRQYLAADWISQAKAPQGVFVLTEIREESPMVTHCNVFTRYIDAKYTMNQAYHSHRFLYESLNIVPDPGACSLLPMSAEIMAGDPAQKIRWRISACLPQEGDTLSLYQKYRESLVDVSLEGPINPVKSKPVTCPAGRSLVSSNYDMATDLLWYTIEEQPDSFVSPATIEWCIENNKIESLEPKDAEGRVMRELGVAVDFEGLGDQDA